MPARHSVSSIETAQAEKLLGELGWLILQRSIEGEKDCFSALSERLQLVADFGEAVSRPGLRLGGLLLARLQAAYSPQELGWLSQAAGRLIGESLVAAVRSRNPGWTSRLRKD